MQAARTEDSCGAVTDETRRKRRTVSITSGCHGGIKLGGLGGCRRNRSPVCCFSLSLMSDFREQMVSGTEEHRNRTAFSRCGTKRLALNEA